MDFLLGFPLFLLRALPFDIALLLSRAILILYLGIRKDYREEILANYRLIFGNSRKWFWLKNAWRLGRNFTLMARIGTKKVFELIDRAVIYAENNQCLMSDAQHRIMVSYHFGLWEFLPHIFAPKNALVILVVSRQRSPLIEKFLSTIRTSTPGIKIVTNVRSLYAAYSRYPSSLIGFVLDNTSQGKQMWLEAEGIAMRLPSLPFQIGSTIPVFSYLENGRPKVKIFPPGDGADALKALIHLVRQHPEEWVFWGKAGALNSRGGREGGRRKAEGGPRSPVFGLRSLLILLRNRRRKTKLGLALFLCLSLFLSACKEAIPEKSLQNLPDQVVKDFTLHESMTGRPLYTLMASEASVFESEGRIDVQNPRVVFYEENGATTAVLTAATGVMWTKTQNLIARDNVRVETADSTVLLTDSLMWNNARQQVYTDAPVTIISVKGKVSGQGLIADAGLKKIEILSEIRGNSDYEFQP